MTLYGGSDWVVSNLQDVGGITRRYTGFDLLPAAKFTVAFLLSYQWLGSVRHMYWDLTAKGFTNNAMLKSAYGVVGSFTTPLASLWCEA